MSSPLIFIPKKVTQDVDFAPQLRQVISRTYSEQPDAYNDELALLNRARQDALRGSAGSDVTARDLLYKYFGQLELLELRFPELRVPFPWNDAFTHVKISQLSLAYEKASVIFNIGATLASLAAAAPRSSPEGLKRAYHSFRCAAGMFTYINDNFLHAPSTDLSRDVVKLLVGLMGAQATEVFIETMGPATQKGAGLRAKLCMQASTLYGSIVEEVKEWVTKGVFIREWGLLIQTKAKYFASLAQYYRSLADSSASKYGDALARLNISDGLAKEALRLAQTFATTFSTSASTSSLAPDAPVAIVELTKTHAGLVADAKTKAQKDNDIVYNEVVPSEASLAPIDTGKDVAEPIAIHDVYASPDVQKIVGPDLFAKLVPLSVHESASMYSEEKAKLARAEADRAELADVELAAALEYMGLPASLERFGDNATSGGATLSDPGAQVRGWADELRREEQSAGGRIEDLLRRRDALRSTAARQLDDAARDLDAESRECEALRNKYGSHNWDQPPSAPLTRGYRAALRAHRESLEQAKASDAMAQGLWDGARRDVGLLLDAAALERTFVEAVAESGGAGSVDKTVNLLDADDGPGEEERSELEQQRTRVARISEALSKLSKVKKERADVLKDLKERIQADDISHLLILNRKGSASVEPTLFATELEKFRPHQNRITTTIQVQQATLSDISTDFEAITRGKKAQQVQTQWADAERRKRDLITRLGRATQSYHDVRSALHKGTQFYQDLGDLVGGLKEQVDGFVRQRDAERSDLAAQADIKQRLEGPRMSSPHSSTGLDRQMGSLDLGGGGRSPSYQPPSMPSWSQSSSYGQPPSNAGYPQPPAPPSHGRPIYASSPPPPAPSPYASMPSSGAFASSSSSYYAPSPPPPVPRQPSLPPPSQPVAYSGGGGGLPPPPTPLSYQSQSPSPGYGYSSSHQPPAPSPHHSGSNSYAPPQQQQPASPYGQSQYQQQQQHYGGYGSQLLPPPPPPRGY